jgi:single-strand DNA-binding protein
MLKATLIGNLGGDPEMRYSASGNPFLRMNVASNFRVRSPEGEWQDKTEWVRVTVMGQRAETLAQHLKKGMRVFVEGRLEARPWTSQQGEVRAGLEVVANDVEFMSSRTDDEQRGGGGEDSQEHAPARSAAPPASRPAPSTPVPPRPAPQPPGTADPLDDDDLQDLPF